MLTLEDFTTAESIADLKRRYEEDGQIFRTKSTYHMQAKKDWRELNQPLIEAAPKDLPEEAPHSAVIIDNVLYKVYGVVHTQKIASATDHLYNDAFQDDDITCILHESQLDSIFTFPCPNIDMRDHSAFILEYVTLISIFHLHPLILIAHMFKHETDLDKNPESIYKHRAIVDSMSLPLRLREEFLRSNKLIYNLRLGRSKYMAEFMRLYAAHTGYKLFLL